MRTRIKVNIIKLFLVVCVFLLSNLNAHAFNALSGVDVKQVNDNLYNITLKVDNSVRIKKVTDSKDNLTLILSSIIPSDSIEIVYDNTSDLKNVIVQKKNDQNTVILFQGKNIENAKIYTKELSTGLLKSLDANPGTLNNYHIERFVEENREQLIADIGRLVAVPSVEGEQTADIRNQLLSVFFYKTFNISL